MKAVARLGAFSMLLVASYAFSQSSGSIDAAIGNDNRPESNTERDGARKPSVIRRTRLGKVRCINPADEPAFKSGGKLPAALSGLREKPRGAPTRSANCSEFGRIYPARMCQTHGVIWNQLSIPAVTPPFGRIKAVSVTGVAPAERAWVVFPSAPNCIFQVAQSALPKSRSPALRILRGWHRHLHPKQVTKRSG